MIKMIADPLILSEIAKQWAAVRTLCRGSHRQAMVPGAGMICETPPEELFNLPLVLAYGVVDQVLNEFISQGTFPKPPGRNPMLGAKMDASRAYLSWLDYAEIQLGKKARNDVAHEGILSPKADCLRFIDTIERQLKAWGIIV